MALDRIEVLRILVRVKACGLDYDSSVHQIGKECWCAVCIEKQVDKVLIEQGLLVK